MTDKEFELLLENFENDDLEFRVSINHEPDTEKNRTAKTVVAFYNTRGGKIIYGVHEDGKKRTVIGLDNPQVTETNIVSQINNHSCNLDEHPTFKFIKYQGKDVLIVSCPKGKKPPYKYKNDILVRRGSNNYPATEEEVAKMYRDRDNSGYDKTIVQNSSIDDIDINAAEAYLEGLKLLKDEPEKENVYTMFCKVGLLQKIENNFIPTIAGIMLFGKNPQVFFPNFIIKADIKEYDDDNEWTPLDIKGTIQNQIIESIKIFNKYIKKKSKIIGYKRVEDDEYPQGALREALINAIAHRDYGNNSASISIQIRKNCIRIINPGGIMPPLTLKDVLSSEPFTPITRNPIIAQEILRNGFMERRGNGFLLIKKEIRRAGLPEPKFIEKDDFFCVEFSQPETENTTNKISIPDYVWEGIEIDQDSEKIIKLIEKNSRASLKDFELELKKTKGAFMKKVDYLLDNEIIERFPPKPKPSPKAYYTIHEKYTKNKDLKSPSNQKNQPSLF